MVATIKKKVGSTWDQYLEESLKDKDARELFVLASGAWDIALQIAALRNRRGLTQAELARAVGTRQSDISRLEDADYRGYSLRTLARVAAALGARLDVTIIPEEMVESLTQSRPPKPLLESDPAD